MARLRNSVRVQRLEVDAGSPTVALALQPRLGDINRRRLVPLIDRVLEEMAVPGRQVRIDRLTLDLGEVSVEALEAELPRRLEAELRRAVAAALRGEADTGPVRERSVAKAREELLERHLLRGTLPFWAPPGTTLRALVGGMATSAPARLAALVRRLGRDRLVRERLAAQLPDPVLARLVRVLEPGHAALVVAYAMSLRRVHRRTPLLPLGDDPFRRLLWVLVQAYLVREPGTEFNRRSFVRFLVRGMAAERSLEYRVLLDALARALAHIRRRGPASSLPAVVAALVREASLDSHRDEASDLSFDAPPAEAGASPDEIDVEEDGVDRGIEFPDNDLRVGFSDEKDPSTAVLGNGEAGISSDESGSVIGGDDTHSRASRQRDARASADDRAWIGDRSDSPTDATAQSAIEPATRTDVDPRKASEPGETSVRHALDDTRRGEAVHVDDRSVPARRDAAAVSHRSGERSETPDSVRTAGTPREDAEGRASPERREQRETRIRPELAALATYDTAETIGYLLHHGVLPWSALLRDPRMSAARLLSALPDLPLASLHSALRPASDGERASLIALLGKEVAEDDVARLVLRMLPAAGTNGPFREMLARFADAASDRRMFLARVAVAAAEGGMLDLEALAGLAIREGPPRPAALDAWPAHLLRSVLIDVLRERPVHATRSPAPADLVAALARAHTADARYTLRALAAQPALATTLARTVPPTLHAELVALLDPAAAGIVHALHRALATVPSPHRRAGDDDVREVLLFEMMRLRDGDTPGEAFFARVLDRLFGPRIPDVVARHLLDAAEEWARPGALPPARVAAFSAAVRVAWGEPAAPEVEDAPPRPASPPPDAVAPALREAVFAYLLGRPAPLRQRGASHAASKTGVVPSTLSPDVLHHVLERMVDEAPAQVVPFLRRHSADRRVRERWVQVLPEPALARLTRAIAPPHQGSLLETAEMLDTAWQDAAPPGVSTHTGRPAFWGFVLDFLSRHSTADRLTDRLVTAFFADRAARCRSATPPPDLPSLGARLLEGAGRVALARGHARLRAALHRQRNRLLAAWTGTPSPESAVAEIDPPARATTPRATDARSESSRARRSSPSASRPGDERLDEGEPIYVTNAGLVLVAPFLPQLFRMLGLLGEAGDGTAILRDDEAASRAVHLLQLLVDGRTDAPEPELVLNKLLCGLPPETPVDAAIAPTDAERAACEGMLAGAVLANWPALRESSVAALRETFLQREGKVVFSGDAWRLTVQRKTLDVLVDGIPWSFSVVLHPWMTVPLHVSW